MIHSFFNEFKKYALGNRSFLFAWLFRTVLVFVTYVYSLDQLEKFKNGEFGEPGYPWIQLVSLLQFLLIFVVVYLFRKDLDPDRSITADEYFLFLLRVLLALLAFIAAISVVVIGIIFGFQISLELARDPHPAVKFGAIAIAGSIFPTLLLYFAVAASRLKAILSLEDWKNIFSDRILLALWAVLVLLFGIVFWFPALYVGFPSPEDMERQYGFATVTIYAEVLPFLLIEILHLALIFRFVKKIGGPLPDKEEIDLIRSENSP